MIPSRDEYLTLRRAAGILDRSERGKIVLTGSDRRSYLHGLLTNDIVGLAPGQGCYSAYLTPAGRMVTDMLVFETGDVVLLDVPPQPKDLLLERLDQFIFTEDVALGDVSGSFCSFGVYGPQAAAVVRRALQETPEGGPTADIAGFALYQNVRATYAGEPVVVARVDDHGLGFNLYADRRFAESLRASLVQAGGSLVGREAADTVRIENGRPAFGQDMDDTTIPLEAGIEDRAISFTKGCYVGQEVIVRVLHRGKGRVARRLCGLLLEGETVPSAGDRIQSGERDVGRVTSATFSFAQQQPAALAYLQRDFTEPGTVVSITHNQSSLAGRVVELPLSDASATSKG
jgi:tRNA-modifying protein YgfZ